MNFGALDLSGLMIILGSYPNNHQNIYISMMKKFEDYVQSSKYNNLDIELQPLLSEVSNSEVTGALIDSCDTNTLLKSLREYILTALYHKHLTELYNKFYSNVVVTSRCASGVK